MQNNRPPKDNSNFLTVHDVSDFGRLEIFLKGRPFNGLRQSLDRHGKNIIGLVYIDDLARNEPKKAGVVWIARESLMPLVRKELEKYILPAPK